MDHRAKRLTAWARHAVLGAAGNIRPWLGRAAVEVLSNALAVVVAVIMLFEQWGWEPLHFAVSQLARLRPVAALERMIMQLPPYGALAVFAVPVALLIPVKLGALYLLASGHPVLAIELLIAAKLIGTGIVARIYFLTQPQLMRIAWLAPWIERFIVWEHAIFTQVRKSWAWRWGRVVKFHAQRRLGQAWLVLKAKI